MVLFPSRWLAEPADGDACVTYAMPTVHDMLWFSLEADQAVDVGPQLLPVLPIALEALCSEGYRALPTVLHMREHGDDMSLDIRTYSIGRELSGRGIVMDSEEACRPIEGAEDL
jgi:hypothetical protein